VAAVAGKWAGAAAPEGAASGGDVGCAVRCELKISELPHEKF
jgi:hypothetical protein